MQSVIRNTEEQLTQDITGLHDRLQILADPNDLAARRAASFIRQVIKSKEQKRATLRYRRRAVEDDRVG